LEPPIGSGQSAIDWMSHHGYTPCTPNCSPSALDTAMSNPFVYLLSSRYRLAPRYERIEAFSRGIWFHKRFEYLLYPDNEARTMMSRAWSLHQRNLLNDFRTSGVSRDKQSQILEEDRHDMQTTTAWFDAARTVPIGRHGTFEHILKNGHFTILDQEVTLVHQAEARKSQGSYPLKGRIDGLLLNNRDNTLWVLDLKTTGKQTPPLDRMAQCPYDTQTLHYIRMLHLMQGHIIDTYKLDPSTTVGGMIHLVVAKPPIEYGENDRPYTLDTTPLKSGPNKGKPKNKRVYSSVPNLAMYTARCREWFLGEGDYLHEAEDRKLSPKINISYTKISPEFDHDDWFSYHQLLHNYERLSMGPALLQRFYKHPSGASGPYAPFYPAHPRDWPSIIQEHGFRYRPLTADEPGVSSDNLKNPNLLTDMHSVAEVFADPYSPAPLALETPDGNQEDSPQEDPPTQDPQDPPLDQGVQ
jgi:hypothetical protein